MAWVSAKGSASAAPVARTGQIAPKSVYVERVEGITLGCGIYTQGETAQAQAAPRARVRLIPPPRPS